MIRNDIHVTLNGEHAEANIMGVYLMDGSQHVDNQVLLIMLTRIVLATSYLKVF